MRNKAQLPDTGEERPAGGPGPVSRDAAGSAGFTLVEMIVVVFILGMLLFVSIPRFQQALMDDDIRSAARWIVSVKRLLSQQAADTGVTHILHLDTTAGLAWITMAGMPEEEMNRARDDAKAFGRDVSIREVLFPGGRGVTAGAADIRFFGAGYSDKALIRLRDADDREITIFIEPFLDEAGVVMAHAGFEDG